MGKTDNATDREESIRSNAEVGLAVVAMLVVAGLLLTPEWTHVATLVVAGCVAVAGALSMFVRDRKQHVGQPRSFLQCDDAHRQGCVLAAEVERWLHSSSNHS